MKILAALVALLVGVSIATAQNPSYRSFDSNQFSYTSGHIWIKNGAKMTNPVFQTSITLNGSTITSWPTGGTNFDILDVGTIFVTNGITLGGTTATNWVWVNESGVITPAPGQTTNTLLFTSGLPDNATNAAMYVTSASQWTNGALLVVGTNNTAGLISLPRLGILNYGSAQDRANNDILTEAPWVVRQVRMDHGSFDTNMSIAFQVRNDQGVNWDNGTYGGLLYAGYGSYGVDVNSFGGTGTNGESVAVLGYGSSSSIVNYGLIGIAESNENGQTNVAGAFTSVTLGNSGVYDGLYVETTADENTPRPNYENSVLLLDSRTTGFPLITARTNNGSTVFQVQSSGTLSAVYTNRWALGAVKTCSATTIVLTNYIEVVIDGVTNAIPIVTITP